MWYFPRAALHDAQYQGAISYAIFSGSKIISYQFHIDNNEGESGIGCEIIIGCDLMVHLGLLVDYKYHVLQ